MSHFNFKSLAFYGGAIAVVVVLFETVTAYGETNLKAPPSIEGRYPISFAQKPNCLSSDPLVLTIQQSGSYLNASLSAANTNDKGATTTAKEKPSLTGRLSNQQVSISGASKARICNNASSQAQTTPLTQDNHPSQVNIQGRLEGKNLEGKITISSIPGQIGFTAQREDPVQSAEKSTSH